VFERFTDRARRVLVLAQEEARLLNHPRISPDHILLGLLAEADGAGAKALLGAGADLEQARAVVKDQRAPVGQDPGGGSPPFTPDAKKALENSLREALSMGHSYIGTEHLLLGLLDLDSAAAQRLFQSLALNTDELRLRVDDLIHHAAQTQRVRDQESRRLRIHVLEGLLRGIELYGEVVEAVSHCADRGEALRALTNPPFGFSEVQADRVLDLGVVSVTDENRSLLADELAALEANRND
jgi:ATP-dependent Clp protease ATP-binding subunit ClpA